jgi:hypothetical protein
MTKRKVTDIYRKILLVLSYNESILKNELDEYINSLWNKAPEQLSSSECWIPFLNILNDHYNDTDDITRLKIQEILSN